MLTAFVLIQTEPAKIAQTAQAIANLPNVAEVYSVTGDFDIIAVIWLADYKQLAEVVPEKSGADRRHHAHQHHPGIPALLSV